jgi:hypothetical protein
MLYTLLACLGALRKSIRRYTFRSMSLTETTSEPVIPQKSERKLKITRQVKTAIEAMVWQGLKRADAAQAAEMKDNSLYVALRRPDVKSHYLQELEVLRLSERARSVFRLTELRDQDDNKMVAFNAAKELAGGSQDERSAVNSQSLPGLVVQINVQSGTVLPEPMRVVHDLQPSRKPSD